MKLGGKNKQCPRWVTDITGPDPLSSVELGGGGVNRKKIGKMGYL